jgi:dipeptidyl-peptidase-4
MKIAPRFDLRRLCVMVACLFATLTDRPAHAEDRAIADTKTPSAVRFDPVTRNIEGWTVHVEPALIDGPHAEEGAQALKMLGNHLQRIAILVPEPHLSKLRKVDFWVEHTHPELKGKQYHPDVGWLTKRGYDARLAKKVHITHAAELFSRQQMLKHPAVVLHELAHGYHDQVLGFDDRRVIEAHQNAMKAGIYDQVMDYAGRTVPHYATTNHKEYFAEMTEAYFYRNDFFPFVRGELKRHDPEMHKLLVEIWGETR